MILIKKLMTRLSRIKNYPFTYCIVYILIIPLFAIIFNSFPNEFYQSNIESDIEIKNEHRVLEHSFFTFINNEYEARNGDLLLDFDSLKFFFNPYSSSLKWQDSELKLLLDFSLMRSFVKITNGCTDSLIRLEGITLPVVVSDEHSYYSFEKNDENKIDTDIILSLDQGFDKYIQENKVAIASKDFSQRCLLEPWSSMLRMPDTLVQKVNAYLSLSSGYLSSDNKGNFNRMFYLSAITIATVGFGDIVPVSNRARLSVALEAILGIIMIGLFLNSLSNRINLKS